MAHFLKKNCSTVNRRSFKPCLGPCHILLDLKDYILDTCMMLAMIVGDKNKWHTGGDEG